MLLTQRKRHADRLTDRERQKRPNENGEKNHV